MTLYTIGFTKKSAARFFGALKATGASRLIDVRLHNVSQLAGFAKRDDLAYFLREINEMDYLEEPQFAPTAELLAAYRQKRGSWERYEEEFTALIEMRGIGEALPRDMIENAVLLCSEDSADRCHRRLVAEHLQRHWGDLEVQHLR